MVTLLVPVGLYLRDQLVTPLRLSMDSFTEWMKSVMDVCLEDLRQTDPIADHALATNQCREQKKRRSLNSQLNRRVFHYNPRSVHTQQPFLLNKSELFYFIFFFTETSV